MSGWLDPVRAALDRRSTACDVFFRDDDAGWEDARLRALLDRFAHCGMPIDVAVIPAALGEPMAMELRLRVADAPEMLGLHQHGYRHVDHEAAGRKCEFGPGRDAADQWRDIRQGGAVLQDLLGPIVDPFFTPPWNRCTSITGQCLVDLGYRLLSREHRAVALGLQGLSELPVSIDWCKREDGRVADPRTLAASVAAALGGEQPLGIMVHHAVMGEVEQDNLAELLTLLAGRAASRVRLMRQIVRLDACAVPAVLVGSRA